MPAVLQELLWTSTPENTGETLQVVGPVSSTNDVVMVKSSPYTAFALAAFVTAIVIYGIFFVIEICDKRVSDEKALKIIYVNTILIYYLLFAAATASIYALIFGFGSSQPSGLITLLSFGL